MDLYVIKGGLKFIYNHIRFPPILFLNSSSLPLDLFSFKPQILYW